MAKSKKKKRIKNSKKFKFLIIGLILICALLIVFMIINLESTNEESSVQNSQEVLQSNLDNPAVYEAKIVADKYFKAASNCDTASANSLLLVPNETSQNSNTCLKKCTDAITYKYIKPIIYDDSEVEGVASELATLSYSFTCDNKTYPISINLVRAPELGEWLVLNTL